MTKDYVQMAGRAPISGATVQPTTDVRETSRLISSEKVTGTSVENTRGDSLGHIEEIMIDKVSGQVGYAVLKYGSFLGMGGKLFALPWDQLKYDTNRNAYVVAIPEERLKSAPSFEFRSGAELGRSKICQRNPRLLRIKGRLVSLRLLSAEPTSNYRVIRLKPRFGGAFLISS